MRSNAEYATVTRLVLAGQNDCQISRATGIPRGTVRDWRHGKTRQRRIDARSGCPSCGHPEHDFAALPQEQYSYLLAMYLGDGHISEYARGTYRLRVFMDMNWPDIMFECAAAMEVLFPRNPVSFSRPDPRSGCAVASVYSKQLVCLFPQHGPGPKHLRCIELVDWQQRIVERQPEQFLRGLIHSDGCRFINRVRIKGKTYEYPRYNFTSASDDIRGLFTSTCDLLGIEWRRMNARNISVARRASVARMDEFIGPKS
jgi:hypothetical protein